MSRFNRLGIFLREMGKTISYDTPFKSEPMSRKRIREIAERLKKLLKIPVDHPYVDVTKVLELICDEYPEFSFEIVNDDFLKMGFRPNRMLSAIRFI